MRGKFCRVVLVISWLFRVNLEASLAAAALKLHEISSIGESYGIL